jgi:DNA helicase MCM9
MYLRLILLQEKIHNLNVGSIPRSIIVILFDDLVDTVQAGDDVVISGIPMRRWKPLNEEERMDLEMVFVANHVEVRRMSCP